MQSSFTIISSCVSCSAEVKQAIYNSTFLPNLFRMLIGFIVIGIIVGVLTYFSFRRYETQRGLNPDKPFLNPVPLSATALILGIGIGGFIDGIWLHQILQWHGMFTNQLPALDVVGKSVNMFWDGIFHLFTLTAVIIGVAALGRLLGQPNINPAPRLLGGECLPVGDCLILWKVCCIIIFWNFIM